MQYINLAYDSLSSYYHSVTYSSSRRGLVVIATPGRIHYIIDSLDNYR